MNRYFDLYLTAGHSVPVVINCNQYDSSETWIFTLYTEDDQLYTPASGSIVGLKSDGHTIANAGTVNSDGQVVIQETVQITAAKGINVFELVLDGNHGTANFVVLVEPRPGDNVTPSDSELTLMEQAIAAAGSIGSVSALTDIVNSVNSRMDEFIADHAGLSSETVLWTGELYKTYVSPATTPTGGKATLSQNVTDFDYIGVYTTMNTLGDDQTAEVHWYNADDFAENPTMVTCGTTKAYFSTTDWVAIPYITLLMDSDEVTCTVFNAGLVSWNGQAESNATSQTSKGTTNYQGSVVKIVGIKNTQNDTEVIDARVGADGTVYNTLEARLNAENSALKSALEAIGDLDTSVMKVTGFQQGYRHERPNASLTINSKWVITTEPFNFSAGQTISVESGYEYVVVDPDPNNYGAYIVTRRSTSYTFAEDTSGYIEVRVAGGASDITPADVSGIVVSVITSYNIVSTVNSLSARVNKITKFVSTSGSDTNNGNTPSSAYATIAKALSTNADIIYIGTGTYTENIYEYTGYRYGGVKIYANEATLVNSNSLHFRFCDVEIEGLTIQSSSSDSSVNGIQLLNCTGRLRDCKVSNAPNMGFVLNGCRMTLERCEAESCGVDGFNAHDVSSGYHTDCTLIDCIAHGCGDDGLSFHENGKMHVIGGEYYNNVSTGIAPHQFCDFEIRNAYIHGNGTGIEAENPDYVSGDKAQGLIIGCVIESNNKTGRAQTSHIGYGVRAKQYEIKALGNAVVGNTNGTYYQDIGGVITVYGSGEAADGNEVYY